jgi:WhiB family redox-sensing transcriptional regulator
VTATFNVRRFVNRPEWMADANCAGLPTELFFPTSETNRIKVERNERRALEELGDICRRCDVQAECLAYALNLQEPGIWAGTTTHQRRLILRSRASRPRGPVPPPIELVTHEHGTANGYRMHRYYGTEPCQPCLNGHALYVEHSRPSGARGVNA